MKKSVSITIGAILVAATIAAGIYFYSSNGLVHIEKQSITTVISNMQKTKQIDKLYTGVYLIPALDTHRGKLKRDMVPDVAKQALNPMTILKSMDPTSVLGGVTGIYANAYEVAKMLANAKDKNSGEDKTVVKGCCLKQFEVAVGYEHLLNIIGNEKVLSAVCSGNKSELPNPQILAVNCIHTDIEGDYKDGECFKWDSDDKLRKQVIQKQMSQDGIWQRVEDRGKESLKNFMSILCN